MEIKKMMQELTDEDEDDHTDHIYNFKDESGEPEDKKLKVWESNTAGPSTIASSISNDHTPKSPACTSGSEGTSSTTTNDKSTNYPDTITSQAALIEKIK